MRIPDWTVSGERGTWIPYEIEIYPLQIRTDSAVGSEDVLRVGIAKSNESRAGLSHVGIQVVFSNPPIYKISCWKFQQWNATQFDGIPAGNTRVWTIEKTEKTLKLSCNMVTIFHVELTELSVCSLLDNMLNNLKYIKFKYNLNETKTDNASKMFRAKPAGKKHIYISLNF